MALEFKSLDESIEDTGVKILIHGPAGTGKTTFCASGGDRTLIISAESGLLSLKHLPKKVKNRIKVQVVESLKDLDEVYDYLLATANEPDFAIVALDSITEIAERILAYEKENAKDPRQAYGALAEKTMEKIRNFRDIPGYHVVFSCQQDRVKDEETGRMMYFPLLPGAQLGKKISYHFDEVFAARVEKDEDGVDYHILQTRRDIKYEAKDRSGELEMFEEPNLKYILQKIKGEQNETADEASSERAEPEAKTEASKDSKDDSNSGAEEIPALEVAKKKIYAFDLDSESFFTIEKGAEIPDCKFKEMTKKEWEDAQESETEELEEGEE